jgi:hypothetical protein
MTPLYAAFSALVRRIHGKPQSTIAGGGNREQASPEGDAEPSASFFIEALTDDQRKDFGWWILKRLLKLAPKERIAVLELALELEKKNAGLKWVNKEGEVGGEGLALLAEVEAAKEFLTETRQKSNDKEAIKELLKRHGKMRKGMANPTIEKKVQERETRLSQVKRALRERAAKLRAKKKPEAT